MAKKGRRVREEAERIQVNIYFPPNELSLVDEEAEQEGPPAPSRSFIIRKLCAEAVSARRKGRQLATA